jgi:hypothetical protein
MEEKIKRPFDIINEVLNHQELSLQVLDALELYSRRLASLTITDIPNIGIIVFNRAYGDFDFLYSTIGEIKTPNEKIILNKSTIAKLANSIALNQFGEKKMTKELEKEKEILKKIISDFFKITN